MSKKVKIGIIGLGNRGRGLIEQNVLLMKDIEILALCDEYEDRVQQTKIMVEEANRPTPFCSTDYKDVLNIEEIEAVLIFSAWESHVAIAIDAMKAGKYVGVEVGGAYSLENCWELVRVSEETNMPCMMLENCCYGRTEMMILNMVKKGIFGEVIHCEGGYHHDLRNEISNGIENRHYRFRNYLNRNCENYPTHELGPICNVLNINRGNRLVSLTSTASKAVGLHEYIVREKGADSGLASATFAQGDIVKTTIKCAGGQTISLTLDTTLPGAYCRGFNVRGTKAQYNEVNNSIYIDGVHEKYEANWSEMWGNAVEFREEFDHPIWKEYIKGEIQLGHDGIDWLVLRAFFESVKSGTQTPIDVYDTVTLMCISVLSEQSIQCGGGPVAIPDFTSGKWISRKPDAHGKYCLSEICIDDSVSIFGS